MLYLLDANVLIDANRDYYPIDRIPEFWEWLVHHGEEGDVKIPVEVYEEIKEGSDDLAKWAKDSDIEKALLLKEEADPEIVSRVIDQAYAKDLTDDEIEKLGRDPFLISYALANQGERCLVTTEGSKPSKRRANRHIPDVCADLKIPCRTSFEFLRELDFRTGWKNR
jgi:hypothetical protein